MCLSRLNSVNYCASMPENLSSNKAIRNECMAEIRLLSYRNVLFCNFSSSVIIHYKENCKSAEYSARMCRSVGAIEAFRGGSRISEKGVHMYNGACVWGRFADNISFFLNIPWKGNHLA